MRIFIPRPPIATMNNQREFMGAWIFANGGSVNNAWNVWKVEVLKNEKRNLSKPFPKEDLIKHGVIEKE
jgi:hypothetical protein